jgi:hypothetical protein
MSTHDFFILLHLVLFCYWLGGDLGVFYSSSFVVNDKLSKETRMVAAKIMLNLDLVPRLCLSLMLTVGGILSEFRGLEHPLWQMVAIILLGPFWLAMVLTIHFKEGTALAKRLTRFDFWFRWAMIVGILGSVTYSFSTGRLDPAPWIGGKLVVFALLIFCGLMIRMALVPFVKGFHNMAVQGASSADNLAMRKSLARVRPWVLVIWAGLLVEAFLGVVEPGGTEQLALLFGG